MVPKNYNKGIHDTYTEKYVKIEQYCAFRYIFRFKMI